MATTRNLHFEAPGPGFWFFDAAHFPRPLTKFFTEKYSDAFAQAWKREFRNYGAILDRLEVRFVNGFAYIQILPALPPADAGDRPWTNFAELSAVSLDMKTRADNSVKLFATKPWREQLKHWDEVDKPAAIRTHRDFLTVKTETLDTQGLLDLLQRLRENFTRMIFQHHIYNLTTMIPTGDYLSHAAEWTGLPTGRLLLPLQGSSPASTGSLQELTDLAAAIKASPEALSLFHGSHGPDEIINRLRAMPDDLGRHMADYLAIVGHRPVNGYDFTDHCAIEMPELLICGIRQALEPQRDSTAAIEEQTALIRAAVPEQHRAMFDELLAEARLVYRLRDERELYNDACAAGVTRPLLLGIGARLVQSGRLLAAEHFLEAGYDEMRAILQGETGAPTAEELRERAELRGSLGVADAPPIFGAPPGPPPPIDWLPAEMQRVARALDAVLGAILHAPPPRTERKLIRGMAASAGSYEGHARKATSPADLGRVKKGDVLVTEATLSTFNVVLPLLGAIVTNRGGVLSHAAIMSREYGIPCVVGTTDATRVIEDGARVRVDGDSGEVTVLD